MKWAGCFLVLTILFGCADEGPRKRPSNILSEDSMALMIAEHHIINARSQEREVRKKRLTDFVKIDQKNLYDSLGVPEIKFKESLDYYLENYEEMVALHDISMEILSTRLAELKASGADSTEVVPKITDEKEIKKPKVK